MKFLVPGIAQPKGSTRAFYVKKLGRAVITNANPKTRPWEQAVRAEAAIVAKADGGGWPSVSPVSISATFYLPRPKGHRGKRGLLPSAPLFPSKKPDTDKLSRALLDALTGVLYVDDSQVVDLMARKRFCGENEAPHVAIDIVSVRG